MEGKLRITIQIYCVLTPIAAGCLPSLWRLDRQLVDIHILLPSGYACDRKVPEQGRSRQSN